MKPKWKSSIFVKTQIYLGVFCAVLLLTVWLFELAFFSISYKNYQKKLVTSIADKIQDSNNLSSDEVELMAYENNICITIFDTFGDIKEYNTKMNGCMLNSSNTNDVVYSFLNSQNKKISKIIKSDKDNIGYMYGVKNKGLDIFIYTPLKDHSVVNTVMKDQLVYLIIIAIFISCAVSLFISNLITKPIRNITNNAINIGKEIYDTSFNETGIKEIDDLQTALNTAQKELSKVQAYQKDLIANVSHDLKTPLTMIRAYAEKIKDISYKNKDTLDSDVNIITDEVDRLTLLVNDILDLSKIENNVDTLAIEEYDIVPQIKEILKKYDIIKDAEDDTFITDLPTSVLINADKSKIGQVIYNLINNAINYTGDDKKVYISLKKENKSYIFKVTDTGKGIKEDEIKNIWTKYYKNDKNHRRNVISTGIGLSIVKEVLEKHKFDYGVESKLNEGSTFYFKFKESKANNKKSH